MKTRDSLLEKLDELKRAGYSQVSVSELAHVLDLPTKTVITSVHRAGLPNFRRGSELFVKIETTCADTGKLNVHFSDLAQPKSPILREVE